MSPPAVAQFITSFGTESSDDETKMAQGPVLPPHLIPKTKDSNDEQKPYR